MSSIILTGASGFIGKDIIRELKEGFSITAIGRNFHIQNCHGHVKYLEADLNDIKPSDITSELPNHTADFFIHAAGQAHISQTAENKILFVSNNINATIKALDIAKLASVKKFILISSVAVMNNDKSDQYGLTKKEAESKVIEFCKDNDMEYLIIRPVVVYGEEDQKGNVSKLIKSIHKGFFPLLNNGNTIKSMIYVKNLSFMIKEAMCETDCKNQILIARDREELSLKQICKEIKKNMSKPSLLLPVPPVIVDAAIYFLESAQHKGIVKKFNVRSLRNLKTQTRFNVSGTNESLIESLPYSFAEGISYTVKSKMDVKSKR